MQFEDVLGRQLSLRYPGPGSLPPLSHPLSTLLHAFAPRNVLTLVAALLCEWSVILHSSDLAILPVVALSLSALIYPLKVQMSRHTLLLASLWHTAWLRSSVAFTLSNHLIRLLSLTSFMWPRQSPSPLTPSLTVCG